MDGPTIIIKKAWLFKITLNEDVKGGGEGFLESDKK